MSSQRRYWLIASVFIVAYIALAVYVLIGVL